MIKRLVNGYSARLPIEIPTSKKGTYLKNGKSENLITIKKLKLKLQFLRQKKSSKEELELFY